MKLHKNNISDKRSACFWCTYEFDNPPIFIPKNIFSEPYQLDIVFSPYLSILLNLTTSFPLLCTTNCLCENACATSDAYELKRILKNLNDSYDIYKHYKVINTGTVDKFSSRWGVKQMTYLKDKYLTPIVTQKDFHHLFPNSYGEKPKKTKLIIKGLTLLDATLDIRGEYVPGKTTLIVVSNSIEHLSYLAIVINSKVAQFYITQRYSSASYNGGVNFTKDMIKNIPLPTKPIIIEYTYFAKILLIAGENKADKVPMFFQNLADAMVYELYFPDEIKAADAEVLKHLTNLPELKDDWSDEQKLALIDKVYKELSAPAHPVAIAMERQKSVPEVRVIEGLDTN